MFNLTKPRPAPARAAFIPAPTQGWDDTVNIAAEEKFKALKLDNWFPQPEYVELRKGHKQHADTTETTPVNTLMAYNAPSSANDKLFAASNDTIYNVSGTTATATSVVTLSNSKLQWVNFTTSGGSYLYTVNGANLPFMFDGVNWSNPAITGVDESTFININVFKDRLFFIPVNSTKFWYLPVDTIAGAATSFELGGVMSRGGNIVAMGTITIDGGSGPDDHAVFVTSKGQIIVYQGTDPSDANAWALVGVYEIPPPIGYRCLAKIAGDLGILTIAGVLPLSKAMVIDRAAVQNIAISQNINTTMMRSAQDYGTNYGWSLTVYPTNTMFLVNIPLAEAGETHQYVMNTRHGAWCRFIGQNAASWCVYKDRLFFGGVDGIVYEADCVAEDNGAAILADMVTSYSFYGSRANNKQFKMIKPHIVSDGQVGSAIKMYAEWGSHTRGDPPTNYLGGGSLGTLYWDDGRLWDDGSLWPESRQVTQRWRSVSALGRSASIRMRVQAESTLSTPIVMQVSGFDVIYENGGLI